MSRTRFACFLATFDAQVLTFHSPLLTTVLAGLDFLLTPIRVG
jgi:hypothetical protein